MEDKEYLLLNDMDRDQISELIRNGYTSGVLDSTSGSGKPVRVNWEIKTEKFYL